MKTTLSRGLRNNNPLNIRKTKTTWTGQKTDGTDTQFCQFLKPAFGWRAAFKLLHRYYTIYGLKTIELIVSRWAPSNENDTEAYIESVCNDMNWNRKKPLPPVPRQPGVWMALAYAMARMENGQDCPVIPMLEGFDMFYQALTGGK